MDAKLKQESQIQREDFYTSGPSPPGMSWKNNDRFIIYRHKYFNCDGRYILVLQCCVLIDRTARRRGVIPS